MIEDGCRCLLLVKGVTKVDLLEGFGLSMNASTYMTLHPTFPSHVVVTVDSTGVGSS